MVASTLLIRSVLSALLAASAAFAQSNQFIHPNANLNKCLTAPTNADGAPVTISDCITSGNTASQNWTLSGQDVIIYGNKCLDVTNGNATNGNKLQIWTCGTPPTNQLWSLRSTHIQWADHSSCLDLTDGVQTNGQVMQIWTCGTGPNQDWTITFGPNGPPLPQGQHFIHPGVSNSFCLAAPNNADGGVVVVNPCDGTASQTWNIVSNLFIAYGNKCLDVTNGNTTNGNRMQIWTCTTNDVNQEWSITTDNRIAWTNHGECLDLSNGQVVAGNQVQMWACTDNDNNQVWNIIP